jgi:hypothetical protein
LEGKEGKNNSVLRIKIPSIEEKESEFFSEKKKIPRIGRKRRRKELFSEDKKLDWICS